MSIADIFTVVIALLALLVNVVFATFQITWSITLSTWIHRKK